MALTWSPKLGRAHLGVTQWKAGTDGDFQAGGRDGDGLCQVLEGQGRLWGQTRSLQSPAARRDWS